MHDVLRVASFYMPLQQALVDSAATGGDQSTDLVRRLLNQLVDRSLLQPPDMAHVLEALGQQDGVQSAVAFLLAYVYQAAIRKVVPPRRLNLSRPAESLPAWLETLLQCVERCGNQESGQFREGLPACVLSADGWETVCGKCRKKQPQNLFNLLCVLICGKCD